MSIILPNVILDTIVIRMIIRTRVFDMASGKYANLTRLASAMGLSVSQVYRVREGKRGINEKFIVGAKTAFPDSSLDELFYFTDEIIQVVKRKKPPLAVTAGSNSDSETIF